MTTSIMQPTFLPWLGYFKMISKVNNFIFLDDAQFSKGSWHNRNKVLVDNHIKWITLPVKKPKLHSEIQQVKIISDQKFFEVLNKLIEYYKFHDNLDCLYELISFIKEIETTNLAEINIKIIKFICGKLKINKVTFFQSSKLNVEGKRTNKVANLLSKINAKSYLSAEGARDYMMLDHYHQLIQIPTQFFKFNIREYYQKKSDYFIPNLSIVDIITNLGWKKTQSHIFND